MRDRTPDPRRLIELPGGRTPPDVGHGAMVVLFLDEPREKFWGKLQELSTVGVFLRGIELRAVEDWARELARDDGVSMAPSSLFFPLRRIEKIYVDESVGPVRSVCDAFREISGHAAEEYL